MSFIPLNVRSGYTFLSSGLSIEKIKNEVKRLNYLGCAISDNNLHAYPEFSNALKSINKKYLLGETIEIDNFEIHFYILNEEGYKSIIRLSPYISTLSDVKELLKEKHDGLIAILDTNDSDFFKNIEENTEEFRKHLSDLSSLADEFYLGLNILSSEHIEKAKKIREFASNYGYTTIAFPLVLYPTKKDAISFTIAEAIKNEEHLENTELEGPCYFLTDKVARTLYTNEEVDLTETLLNKADFEFTKKRGELLHFSNEDSNELLKKLAYDAFNQKGFASNEYKERLDYELGIITSMGYADYFLIVQDYVKYAKEHNILVGPGRGSAAGSLISYLLGITEIDPIRYGLLFERFLNPARKTMPDIDMDFMDTHREEVIEYLRNKWGKEKVANIVTFSIIHAKQALRDIGRVYQFNDSDISLLSKRITNIHEQLTLRESYMKNPSFKELIDSDKYYLKIVSLASKIEELPRQTSIHAAGVVLNNEDISKVMPVIKSPFDGSSLTQYEGIYMEDQGFLKMDILGLRNLTTIDDCCALINERYPNKIDKWNIPHDSKEIFELIRKGKTMGLFQLESKGMRRSIKVLQPECFEDVTALLALFRPGPMDNIPLYANRKAGIAKIYYPCPELEPVLKETYGIIVYQEQISQIAMVMAGLTPSEADIFRKAVSKKKIEELKKTEEMFINGCKAKGHDYSTSKKVYDQILKFANYGFNKSHSVGYAYIACRMGYLKAKYPLEFYSAILKTASHTDDVKFADYLKEMKDSGIKILPPSINVSKNIFEINNASLVFPLNEIKGINEQTANYIILEREQNGNYVDFYDFVIRTYPFGFSQKIYESLIDAGAFDEFMHPRTALRKSVLAGLNYAKTVFDEQGQLKLIDDLPKPRIPDFKDDPNEILALELEALDMMLSDNPLNYKKDIIEKEGITPLSDIVEKEKVKTIGIVKAIKRINTKKKETMAFLTIYDQEKEMDVTIFPKLYLNVIDLLKKNNILIIEGKLETSRGETSFNADSLRLLEETKDDEEINDN